MTEIVSTQATGDKALPNGWVWTTVEKLASTLKSGGTPSTKKPEFYNGDIPYAKVEDIVNAGKYLRSTNIKITQAGIDNSSAWVVPKCSLLYTMYASYGIPAISEIDVATNQAIIAFIPPNSLLSLDYLYYYLWNIKPTLSRSIRGTTQANLNAGIVKSIEVPLPPLDEQRRIVEKIEELFTKLDAGVRSLEQARAQLKSYRRAVLNAAVEGDLSREWREAHKDELEPVSELLERILRERREKFVGKKYKEPILPDTSQLPTLANGWVWATVDQLADVRTGGTPLKSNRAYYEEGTIPWVTSGALNNPFVRECDQKITEVALKETNVKLFPKHTLLVAMYGEGKTRGKVSELLIEAATNQACAALIFDTSSEGCKSYVKLFLQKNYDDIRRLSAGGVQPNLNLSIVKSTTFPLPPLTEQRFVVEGVERRFSIIDKLEATIEASIKQANTLRQSILKRAFSGELVPQDPDDEPASVLLERIGEERQEKKQKPRRGRRGKSGPAEVSMPSREGYFSGDDCPVDSQ